MIDTNVESLIPLREAARTVNRSRPPAVSTLWRWSMGGVRGCRLETVVVGGVRFTSREAVQRFLAALNSDTPEAVPAPQGARARRAEAELAARGA